MLAHIAALLLSAAAPDTVWGAIRGVVATDPGGLPLPSAVVQVSSGGVTLTDSTGHYRLAHVAAGPQTVRIHSLDHEPMEVEVLVPARGEIQLDVALRHRPLAIDTISGIGTGPGGASSDAAARGVAAITDFPAFEGPGTGMEGGTGAGSGGDVLLVRGSAADLKLVLLDGAPVYAPFHMGGLIESFEPGLLSGARLYLGGAPARYDGGVNYVLDLATRAAGPERWSGAMSADIMSVRGSMDGPLWRGAGLLVAGRAVHGASLGRLEGQPFPYRYADGMVRMDVALGRRTSIALTGFTNGEGVRVDTAFNGDQFLRWSNAAGSARFRFPIFTSDAELTVAASEFDAWLPNPADRWEVQARIQRARLALDVVRELPAMRLAYGYQYDRQWARHRGTNDHGFAGQPWFQRDTVGSVAGWYVDALYRPHAPLVVRGGLRGDIYAGGPFMAFSPRLSATWLLGGHATLTLAGGRYHQLVLARTQKTFDYGVVDIADSLGIATVPRVASANHLALSLDQEMPGGVRLGLEGYFKAFRDIPDASQMGAHSSGVDVWVRRGEGAVRGWMGYSLAWYWSRPDSVGGPSRFDGRQTLTGGIQAQGRPGAIEVRVAYGSGLQYSALGSLADPSSAPGAMEQSPLSLAASTSASLSGVAPQDFLRLDARVSRTFTPRVGGRETELTPFLRVMNALDRRDALFYRYRPGDDQAEPVATLPVLPVFGVEWRF